METNLHMCHMTRLCFYRLPQRVMQTDVNMQTMMVFQPLSPSTSVLALFIWQTATTLAKECLTNVLSLQQHLRSEPKEMQHITCMTRLAQMSDVHDWVFLHPINSQLVCFHTALFGKQHHFNANFNASFNAIPLVRYSIGQLRGQAHKNRNPTAIPLVSCCYRDPQTSHVDACNSFSKIVTSSHIFSWSQLGLLLCRVRLGFLPHNKPLSRFLDI